MSLYLFTEKLIKNLEKTKFKYEIYIPENDTIVAYTKDKKLLYKNYTEENLKYFVLINQDVKINNFFWNYNYCNQSNISTLEKTDVLTDLEIYNMGKLILEIYMTEILANCFSYMNNYKKYLETINIEKDVFAKFLINLNSKLPLTEGYLELIIKVFSQQYYKIDIIDFDEIDDIIKFLFQKGDRFTLEENKVIFENIQVKNINSASIFITKNSSLNQFDKLKNIDYMILNHHKMIGEIKHQIISHKNRENFLSFNLLNMDIEKENINIYKDVVNNFINTGGSLDINIPDDKLLNDELKQKIMFTNNLL